MTLIFHALVADCTIRNVLLAACGTNVATLGWAALVLLGALIFHAAVTDCTIRNILFAACVADVAFLGRVALIASRRCGR